MSSPGISENTSTPQIQVNCPGSSPQNSEIPLLRNTLLGSRPEPSGIPTGSRGVDPSESVPLVSFASSTLRSEVPSLRLDAQQLLPNAHGILQIGSSVSGAENMGAVSVQHLHLPASPSTGLLAATSTSSSALRRHLLEAGPEVERILVHFGASEGQLVPVNFDACSTPRDESSSGAGEHSSLVGNAIESRSGGNWSSESPQSSEEAGACPKDPKTQQASPKRPPPSESSSEIALPRKSIRTGYGMNEDLPSEAPSLSRRGWLSQLRSVLEGVGGASGPLQEEADVPEFLTPRETFEHPPVSRETFEHPVPNPADSTSSLRVKGMQNSSFITPQSLMRANFLNFHRTLMWILQLINPSHL